MPITPPSASSTGTIAIATERIPSASFQSSRTCLTPSRRPGHAQRVAAVPRAPCRGRRADLGKEGTCATALSGKAAAGLRSMQRRAIQLSEEKNIALAKRYGVSRKTIAKWKARESTSDERMGPKNPCSSVLTQDDEAIILVTLAHPPPARRLP